MEYDTREIRRVARSIGKSASEVSAVAKEDLNALADALEGRFKGKAADALEAILSELSGDLRRMGANLGAIRDEMLAYAARLDMADRQSRDQINEK